MEGHNAHGYLQEDVSYDDLMSGAGWPAPTDQFSFPPPHQAQHNTYVSQFTTHPSFDQYELQQRQQQPYPATSYTNSPYTPQSQYQHVTPSEVFDPSSFNVDPHLQNAFTADTSFSYNRHATQNHNTIAPQNLQYQLASTQQAANRSVSNPTFQHSANNLNQRPQDQAALYFNVDQNANRQGRDSPIQYPALESSIAKPDYGVPNQQPAISDQGPRPIQVKSKAVQNTLRITDPQLPAFNNPSSRPAFSYAPFLSWQDLPVQVAPGLKNTLPKYHPRKSRSGKELVPGMEMSRNLTPARLSSKKIKAPKDPKQTVSKYKGTSKGTKLVHEKLANLRGDDNATVKSPSTVTETSSSEEDSSSEEESEYEEDENMPVKDISEVRSAIRPTDVSAAAGWDAIGIIWKDPYSNPNAEVIREAIEKYGNFLSALRVKLKTNSTQTEAVTSRPQEVEQLRVARQVLLESLYQTIQAANVHGYPAIVENLGSHQKLVNGLTTTLIECSRTEDFLGKLPKAVFSLLAKFQNMSEVLLKKLKFDGITRKWSKKADETIKKDVESILANTTEAKEKAAQSQKETKQAEEAKLHRSKLELAKQRPSEPVKAALNPGKRPHDGFGADKHPNKKLAPDIAGGPSTLKPLPLKRTTNLLGIASKPVAKPAPKKREASPPTASKLGALLASIAEPKAPKAPESKPLPPETPQEKARRERKESRRHLRVKFKDGSDLEEIRLFKHEQAEDEGRQDDMLRDAHDDRSEGMMHKQRVSDMDSAMELDEDEYNPEDVIFEERPYPNVVGIDLTDLDKTTRFGPTYTTRGGEKAVTTPEQEVQQKREAIELMAIYTDAKDIPITPKEPPHGENGNVQQERDLKGPNEAWVVERLQAAQYGPEYASQLLQHQKQIQTSTPSLGASHPLSSQDTPQMSDAMTTSAWENLTRIVDELKGKPYPPTEPPSWMTNEAQRAGWWEGYNRDAAAKNSNAEAQMAQLQAAHYQPPAPIAQTHQPPMMAPIINPFPPPTPAPIAAQEPNMALQYQAYLAAMQVGTANAAPPAQTDAYNGWSNNQDYDEYSDRDAQSRWDVDRENENRAGANQYTSSGGGSKNRGYDMKQFSGDRNENLFDENGEYKGKKKPCKFWMEGKCVKGGKCTFLHENA